MPMTADDRDPVFGRGRLRMATGDHVQVFREAATPEHPRRYTKRFLVAAPGDLRPWTERERRLLEHLGGLPGLPVARLVPTPSTPSGGLPELHTWDAGPTVDQWATRVLLQRDGKAVGNPFEDCATWWALARACLEALDSLHALGFVHLDLKADNLCLPWGPATSDAPVVGQPLAPRFEGLTLIDVAFSLLPGVELPGPLPLARHPKLDYQSPRLLEALAAGRSGDLGPTLSLDWRCDFFALAALLWRYLPEPERAARHGWDAERHALAAAFLSRLVEADSTPLPAQRPHRELIALAERRLAEPEVAPALQATRTFHSVLAMAVGDEPVPRTRIFRPAVEAAPAAGRVASAPGSAAMPTAWPASPAGSSARPDAEPAAELAAAASLGSAAASVASSPPVSAASSPLASATSPSPAWPPLSPPADETEAPPPLVWARRRRPCPGRRRAVAAATVGLLLLAWGAFSLGWPDRIGWGDGDPPVAGRGLALVDTASAGEGSAGGTGPLEAGVAGTPTARPVAATSASADAPLPIGDAEAVAHAVIRHRLPGLAEAAAKQLAPVLLLVAGAGELPAAGMVRAAARDARLAAAPPALQVTADRELAVSLARQARAVLRRGPSTAEALVLETRAFGADPLDPEIAGDLADLLLRESPPQPVAARQLALYALGLRDDRFPGGRPQDWSTLAIASALTAQEAEARGAWSVALALADDLARQCRAVVLAREIHGELLHSSVQATLARVRASPSYARCAEALEPPRR